MQTLYIVTVTQALSLIGSRMTGLAVGIWIFAETGNTSPLMLTAFFLELPGMLIAGLSGVLADRWKRQHVIMLGDAGEALGTGLLLVSLLSGHFQLWHLYAAVLVKGIFMTIQSPAADAATTMLTPVEQRERANALKQLGFPLAGVVAPLFTGLLYPFIGINGIIIIDLVTFAVAVIVIGLVHIPQPASSAEGAQAQGNFWKEISGGIRFLTARRALLQLVLFFTVINFLLNGPLELTIPYLMTITGSEATLGILMAIMNAGALSGALTMALWGGTRPRIHTLFPALLLSGVAMIWFGVSRSPVILGIALFMTLFPLPISNALFMSIMQIKTPADLQGRVFAVVFQIAFLATPLSFLLTGFLVDKVVEPAVGTKMWHVVQPLVGAETGSGMGLVLLISGVLIGVLSALVYSQAPIRNLERDLPDYEVEVAR